VDLIAVISESPLPAPSTFFPYTTLFRSSMGARIRRPAVDRLPAVHHRSLRRPPRRGSRLDRRTPARPHLAPEPAHRVDLGRCRKDRKSTRLNSSHVSISYAVFCLQKNNI